jgi:hypothetical protein
MKNITLSADEQPIEQARLVAKSRHKTLLTEGRFTDIDERPTIRPFALLCDHYPLSSVLPTLEVGAGAQAPTGAFVR